MIYGLYCPLTGCLMYVGQTRQSLKIRLRGHLSTSPVFTPRSQSKKRAWIEFLVKIEQPPVIKVIEVTTLEKANEREIYWINFYRSNGVWLVNCDVNRRALVPPNPSNINQRIRRIREIRGVKKEDIAGMLFITHQEYNELEHKGVDPRYRTLKRFCQVVKIEIGFLVGDLEITNESVEQHTIK